jgi:acetyltransferase-like isoleucine patch superfamily enzyme
MFKMNSYIPKLYMKLNHVHYGKGLRMKGWPFVFQFPGSSVTLGEFVKINSEFFSNLLGLYQRTIIIARAGGQITIGNHVGISGCTIYSRAHIAIGDHTIIGANCKIIDNDMHSLDVEERNNDIFDHLVCKDVTIGESVFVGCNSIILKGTSIGDRCVIGAGSVVSGSFPPDSVIAGNPARVIRRLDNQGKAGDAGTK